MNQKRPSWLEPSPKHDHLSHRREFCKYWIRQHPGVSLEQRWDDSWLGVSFFSCFLIRRCLFLSAPGAREGPSTENRGHAEGIRTPQSQRGEGGGDPWVPPCTCIRSTALVEVVALLISEDIIEVCVWDGQFRFLQGFCLKNLVYYCKIIDFDRVGSIQNTHKSVFHSWKTHWRCRFNYSLGSSACGVVSSWVVCVYSE